MCGGYPKKSGRIVGQKERWNDARLGCKIIAIWRRERSHDTDSGVLTTSLCYLLELDVPNRCNIE